MGACNYRAGHDETSSVIAPIAADGTITIVANTATNVIVDATGYLRNPGTMTTYAYDTTGLRSSKGPLFGAQTTFTWDTSGGLPLLIGQHTAGVDTWILYGPGGQPVEQITGTTVSWLHHDQLGSVRLATDTTGTVVSTRSWDAYGNPKTATGTITPLLGYAGQYTDTETGLQYLRARYYDPKTSQFLSLDPAVSATGEPYGYAGDDPINASDPTGLFGIHIGPLKIGHDGCLLGTNSDGRCRGARTIEKYADDVSNYASAVSGVCMTGAALAAASVLGAELAPVLIGCGSDAAAVSLIASSAHAAVTCNKEFDDYCQRSVAALGVNLLTNIVAGGAQKAGDRFFLAAGCTDVLARGLSVLYPGLGSLFIGAFNALAIDTTERPN